MGVEGTSRGRGDGMSVAIQWEWEVGDACYVWVVGVALSGHVTRLEGEMAEVLTCFNESVRRPLSELQRESPRLDGDEWPV